MTDAPARPSNAERMAQTGEHLSIVRRKAHRVLARRDLHDCVVGELDLAYIGGGPIALGPLLGLWADRQLRLPCACGGEVFVHHAAGSPLSGTCAWSGWCDACRAPRTGRSVRDGFHTLWAPLRERVVTWAADPRRAALAPPLAAVVALLEGHEALEPIVSHGAPWVFDWGCLALHRADQLVLRAEGKRLRDVSGVERFGVLADRVLATDGAPLFTMRREPSRRRHRIEGAFRGLCGGAEPKRTVYTSIEGEELFRRDDDGLWSPAGRHVVSCGPALPDALAGLLALGLLDDDPFAVGSFVTAHDCAPS